MKNLILLFIILISSIGSTDAQNESIHDGQVKKGKYYKMAVAHEFFEKEQAILNDNNLDENQKKEALEELWKDQNQEIIEEFIVQYQGQTSKVVINKKTNFDNQVDDVNHTKIESNEITIPGIKL